MQGAYGFTDSNEVYGHHAEPSTVVDGLESAVFVDEDVTRGNELYVAHSPRRTALPLVVHDEDDEHSHLPELYV